jgi:uncharacterized membrane protein
MTLLGEGVSTLRWESLPPLWLVVLVIVPGVFLAARFFYQREAGRVGRRLRITMGVLRALAILLVLGAIFGPYMETIEGEPAKRHLVVCLDTSASMGLRDNYQASQALAASLVEAAGYPANTQLGLKRRLDLARDIIGRDRAYLERLAERFRLHVYAFDSDTAGVHVPVEGETPAEAVDRLMPALRQLEPDGSVTRIGGAINKLARAFEAHNEPVAGILLFSDGRQTGGAPSPLEAASDAARRGADGIPIFPVTIGDPAAAINIGVSRVDAPEVVLAGDEVYFTVSVHARGVEGEPARIDAAVVDDEGEVIEPLHIVADPFELPGEDEPAKKVLFRHRFDEEGTFDLRIGVRPVPGEAIESDNYKTHTLRVVRLKMRVLLVSNTPNYTYRFLKEMLFRAPDIMEANVLLLSAEPEWPQEASDGFDPINAFPQTKAELAPYDVVILLDVDTRDPRFTIRGEEGREEVLQNLEKWVKSGGGLVLQAGRDGFLPSDDPGPSLRALMPVVPFRGMTPTKLAERADMGLAKGYELTRAGIEHPIMHVLEDRDETETFWSSTEYANQYCWYAPVERAKSSATVLAYRQEGEGGRKKDRDPILAIQEYGLGKVLWLGTDELWRMRQRVENLYYWPFWSGIIRHLATYRLLGGNKRIKVWVDRADGRYRIGESVGIEAKFLDENFEPIQPDEDSGTDLTRTLKLRAPNGEESEITLDAIRTDPPEGIFKARYVAARHGTYRLIAEPEGEGEPAEATFIVEETTVETRDPLMDLKTLQAVARASNGQVLSPPQFHRLLDADPPILPVRDVFRTGEAKRTDLWDRAWVLWLFVAILGLEWILRRSNLLL